MLRSHLFGWAAAFELIPAYFAYISENVSDVSRSFKKKLRASREKKRINVYLPLKYLKNLRASREKLFGVFKGKFVFCAKCESTFYVAATLQVCNLFRWAAA